MSYTYKFAYSRSPLPLLLCKTPKGKEFFALIDTGSEITLLDKNLDDEIVEAQEEEQHLVLHSMHGEEETSQRIGTIKTSILDIGCKEREINFNGVVSDLSSVSGFMKETYNMKQDILAVIGSDYLNKESAVIDCEQGKITI